MNYDKKAPIKITIEGGLAPDRTIQLTLNAYATIEEWIETFKTILIHQTFAEDTIKELFDRDYDESCYDADIDDDCSVDETITYRCSKNNWKQEF
jgi:hypothetical protein